MKTDVDSGLLERLRKIGSILKANVAEGERLRRLPQESFDALSGSGLLTMLTPKSMGGLEVDPVSYATVIEDTVKSDPAAAWTITLLIIGDEEPGPPPLSGARGGGSRIWGYPPPPPYPPNPPTYPSPGFPNFSRLVSFAVACTLCAARAPSA